MISIKNPFGSQNLFYLFILVPLLLIACGENSERKETNGAGEQVSQEEEKGAEEDRKLILFFGNSLTAGMGLEQEEAFPALIQDKIDSLGLNYEVLNAGLSGETTAAGKNRISWVLNQDIDIFVLELGANDGLRGVPVEETKRNLQAIIDTVRKKNPETRILLTGMQIPPSLGREYTTEFREIFPELAEKNDIELVPFLLENVAGVSDLNQSDGIHPTAEGQRIVAENVWEELEPMLKEQAQ